ncbi:NAD(P)-dependent dehydrogenase (short-subunit alcohol dehydrogenase family) [Georgenia soli]|uniref:NAD(P)-dependent dehydrogenase (Short-subunit alcohol dehydrogenase family) n=1 Tax=Georgenia soli TaxID=638953 RepID=A0A2A9EL62_9MICO|nr:SDR family oxidoreductase [Georgenia soli]PFG38980.1 NAD(P)-dependent dehydrogenase (short-subunit alcohol dehydrogenase family) [Georgenia soli]
MATLTEPLVHEPSTTATLTQTAIVTGGAGGIGAAISRRLATAGYAVVVADADAAAAQRTAATLPEVDGADHRGFSGDLTESDVNRALAEAAAAQAPIGVIVNAVGISPKRDGRKISFFEMSDEEWNRVMAVNVSAPFFLIREAYRYMPTDGTASIVNLLSITAKLGTGGAPDAIFPPFLPSTVAYAASKAALQNLTASLSRELAGYRIRVNGVAPGFVQTPMMGEVPPEGPLLDQVPMHRFARPEEIADAVAFLVSNQASYITGTSLDVNGGWLTC